MSSTTKQSWYAPAAALSCGIALGFVISTFVSKSTTAAPTAAVRHEATPDELKASMAALSAKIPRDALLHSSTQSLSALSIPHLDPLEKQPRYPSPLLTRSWPPHRHVITRGDMMITAQGEGREPRVLMAAGPHSHTYFPTSPATSTAAPFTCAIVTCGGLCPGLNTVIREIVMCVTYVYKMSNAVIYGVHNGYSGLCDCKQVCEPGAPVPVGVGVWERLTPERVARVHSEGGSILGSSRGGFDASKILHTLTRMGVQVLFVIGGDGTHRGAAALMNECDRTGASICIAAVPKTIDNDIGLIDVSFGVDTAVSAAVHPIECAHTEARAALNGVGIVKLMGRASGYIAAAASLASRDVNCTLIPEAEWSEGALVAYVQGRLARRGHCVIVVAEGAKSVEMMGQPPDHYDDSGNPIPPDVGVHVKDVLQKAFSKSGTPISIKYIDPSYMIRSSAANPSDSAMCTSLAFNAVHGAMAGYTGFTVGIVDGMPVWLPLAAVASSPPRCVDVTGRMYARLCTSTGQPDLGIHKHSEGDALRERLKRADSFTYVADEESALIGPAGAKTS